MTLVKELETYGYSGDAEEFREVIGELHIQLHPSWNVEQLLCRPGDALRFVTIVRNRIEFPAMPDEVILRTLLNLRKSGNMDSEDDE